MRVKEESENASLKLNIKKIKIMASSSITSWQVEGEKEETVTDFIFLGSKITADGDCSHEMKRHFLLGRKAMTNLDSILKSRDITMPTKVHMVKAIVFPLVMYGCESWSIKKACHHQVASVVSDSMRPHGLQPTRLLCPWDSPGKNTGVSCHSLLQRMKVESESEVTRSCLTLRDPNGLQPTRLLRPWDLPGKSTGVGCHCLLQRRLRAEELMLLNCCAGEDS